MDSIHEIGIQLILFLQGLGGWLTAPMSFFSFLGNEEFFLLIMPAFYWSISPAIGLRLGIILLMSASLNSVFKLLGQGPRPYWYSPDVKAFTAESSFGSPSGHAMNAASVWGGLAASLQKRWVWISAILVIFFIGLSRLYMGVHFPTDVLAGWLLGALFLIVYLKLEGPIAAWVGQLSIGAKIGASLLLSFSLIILAGVARLALGAWLVPETWMLNASAAAPQADPIDPLALSGVVSNSGALFGLLVGVVLIARWGGYDGGGLLWKRAVRFMIGIAGVLLIWRGLGMILPGGEDMVGYVFRYLRYALIGFWISGLGPFVFIRMRLVDRPVSPKKPPRKRKAAVQTAGTD
jgi:membrane-associated phospholipid phosphatase